MSVTIRKLNIGAAMGAVALTPIAIDGAFANDAMSFSIEGGAVNSDFTREKMGAPSDVVDDDFGLYGSVEILRSISPVWDWSVSATGLAFEPGTYFDENDGESVSFKYDFDAAIADLDVGRKWQADRVAMRLGVGVTALSTSENKGFSVVNGSGPGLNTDGGTTDRSYKGIGLRIGAEAQAQLGEDSPFSIYGGASTALTRGRYSYDKGLNDDGDVGSISDSMNGNMRHSEFDIGLEYAPKAGTAFRAGVRRDIFSFDAAESFNFDEMPDEISSNTAYVGVTINF
jgi:hypothetical protein